MEYTVFVMLDLIILYMDPQSKSMIMALSAYRIKRTICINKVRNMPCEITTNSISGHGSLIGSMTTIENRVSRFTQICEPDAQTNPQGSGDCL